MVNAMLEMALSAQATAFGEVLRTWQRFWSGPRVMDYARAGRAWSTPHEVVHQDGTLRLLRYQRTVPAEYVEPVLVCPSPAKRPGILDLQPQRSVVRQLLARGFEVFLIDWGEASAADRRLSLRDYIAGRLRAAADRVARYAPAGTFHLLGYCMGGTLATIYAAVFPGPVKSLSLVSAPLDFSGKSGLLRAWTDPKYFDVDALVDAFGNWPAPLLRSLFRVMSPAWCCATGCAEPADREADAPSLRTLCAVEQWTGDLPPVAGEAFREFVKHFYQHNDLIEGRYSLGTEPVLLRQITCPVLLVTANGDHLIPPEQTEGLRDRLGTTDVTSMTRDVGHIGLLVGRDASLHLWPRVTAWLADRSTPAGA